MCGLIRVRGWEQAGYSKEDYSDPDSSGPEDMGEWKDQSLIMRSKLQMPRSFHPWVKSHQMEGLPYTHRYYELVQLSYWAWMKQQHEAGLDVKADHPPDFFVDGSQAIRRQPWGPVIPMVAQNTVLYIFCRDRVADAEDFYSLRS